MASAQPPSGAEPGTDCAAGGARVGAGVGSQSWDRSCRRWLRGLSSRRTTFCFRPRTGFLGYSGISESDFDSDLINAGGQPVDLVAGASFFDTADSFAMIRGGHIDAAVLGGLQVSARGDLANWFVPARGGGSVGGGDGPGGRGAEADRCDGSCDARRGASDCGGVRLSVDGGALRGCDRHRPGGDRRDARWAVVA